MSTQPDAGPVTSRPAAPAAGGITVVMATRNRRERALGTLARLRDLPERPPVVLVDDGSTDGTAAAVRDRFPEVVVLARGHGGVTRARNAGVRAATTPLVAFCDDDSWWAPGALGQAVRTFAAHPRLALVNARIVVGEDGGQVDPTCEVMAASPLPAEGLPGPRLLGFVACGAVVRRSAFLEVGGFPEHYPIGGEEAPLSLALAAAGWDLAYVPSVVAHHAPEEVLERDHPGRRRNVTRNDLCTAWRYRRPTGAVRETVRILAGARSLAALRGVADAVRVMPSVLGDRRPLPPAVEAQRRLLDRG